MNPEIERYKKKLLRIMICLAFLLTIYFTVAYFIPLTYDVFALLLKAFLPFILAIITAVLIDPLVNLLESKKIKRGFAVIIALILLIISIVFILVVVISRLVVELSALYQEVPFYTRNIYGHFLDFFEVLRNFVTSNPLPAEAQTAILNSMNTVIEQSGNLIAKAINFLFGFLAGLPGFFAILLISTLATFFISKDKISLNRFFYKLVPQEHTEAMLKLTTHINNALVGFFRAELILISITTVLATIGLYILRIDYAFTIGLIVGFLDLLPVVGPGTMFIPWTIFALIFGNYKIGLGLIIVYAIISVVRQITEPKILSQNIGLNPLAVLLSLYLGLKFLGILGIIIGPFTFIVVKGIITSWHVVD